MTTARQILTIQVPAALAATLLVHAPAAAQATTAAAPVESLPPVKVTATRIEAAPFDVPASIDRIDSATLSESRLQVNISENLGGVAGLLARDRQNYAQDVQISMRGFGSRSTFGIRGVRLYVDGIPATLPDGQGQISHVDLGSTERIEVLRGPFSALYGNSSGGVVQVFTEEGQGPPTGSVGLAAGSDDTWRLGAKVEGGSGAFGYVASASAFHTDGYRDHSEAKRNIGNIKLNWNGAQLGKLTWVVNSVDLPEAQDPLGLTRAQFELDPRSVDPAAILFNTRKTVEQTQTGLLYELDLNESNALRAMLYGGHRATTQFQAIPVGPQNNPLHPGGMIDLGRNYAGTDLRWTFRTPTEHGPLTFVAGFAYDTLDEHRRGYQNFVGDVLGVQGDLRRDEDNDVSDTDEYLQASWPFAARWKLELGVRHSSVRFKSTDHYIVPPNGDDSGRTDFSATLPVGALMFSATPTLNLYATAGRGFETPTLNELAYRPDGVPGLNLALEPARSANLEFGAKWKLGTAGDLAAALFRTDTEDEIVTQTNVGGRSTFQNAGRTRREGVELSWSTLLHDWLRVRTAYTYVDARYRDAFATCTATPCMAPNQTIPAGNRIPGTARSSLFAGVGWAPPSGWQTALDFRALDDVPVTDLNSDAAAGYGVLGASLGYAAKLSGWNWRAFGRVDNLFDRQYAGSVIVNEGNMRYFEPAPGRTWLAGVSANIQF